MKGFFGKLLRFLKYFILIYFATSLFFVILYRFVNPPVTPLMVIRVAQQSWGGQVVRMDKSWVALDKMSPDLPLAVIASEDNLFMEHSGFDMQSIQKAREYNARQKGKKVRGASSARERRIRIM